MNCDFQITFAYAYHNFYGKELEIGYFQTQIYSRHTHKGIITKNSYLSDCKQYTSMAIKGTMKSEIIF